MSYAFLLDRNGWSFYIITSGSFDRNVQIGFKAVLTIST